MDINSTDYHDFVIKNGKLIGEFEQMYQKSSNVPWHQDLQVDWLDVRLAIELLTDLGPFDEISDFGCGLGYFLNRLSEQLGRKDAVLHGFDVSKTCCEKAQKLFPNISFEVLDLTSSKPRPASVSERGENTKALFSLRGTLWYVFPKLDAVVDNIAGMMGREDILLVAQNFPPLEDTFVGKDVLPDPEAIIHKFSRAFIPIKSIWLQDRFSEGNVNWFLAIFSKK